tara:strand:- start:113 stop:2143 length:2031 start_codon:yes stop_codon:yes gene_type:complete
MAKINAENIHNVLLMGHGGSGKTMLGESMLYAAKHTSRIGKIEDGTTISDYEPEEQKRQTSVQTTILPTIWKDHKINLIDTPGYADFRGEVISGLRVAESAIIVISAAAGIETGTMQMWNLASTHKIPRSIYISKMDRENVDFESLLSSIKSTFGRQCIPLQIPLNADGFSGSVNLLQSAGNSSVDQDEAELMREELIELVAETDDELATKYLEGEVLTDEELLSGLKNGIKTGAINPVFLGSTEIEATASEFMDSIISFFPTPLDEKDIKAVKAGTNEPIEIGHDSDSLAALIFKTSADPFVGKLSHIKIYSGTLKSDSSIWNANAKESERIGQVYSMRGQTQENSDEISVGDIGTLTKLSSALTGHTLTTKDANIELNGIEFPNPVYNMSMKPKTQADLDKMTSSIARICEEDPSLKMIREENTLEMLLCGLGDTHLDVALEKMKRKFGVEILLDTPKVAYKETISGNAKVEYRHKKQSGGHGQFGHVWLEMEPLARGGGFDFQEKIYGGSVPKEYIPSVQKGVVKAMDDGVIAGYPVVDIKATLVDGSFHPVDSSGICFEIAGGHAFLKGLKEAKPVLLEPVMKAAITVSDEDTGEIMGDLNGKRGKILGMNPEGNGATIIEAEVPQSEMLKYATDLRSITQGRGSYTLEFDHYEEVPNHMLDRVVQVKESEE